MANVKTFQKNSAGSKKLSANFTVREFACKDGSNTVKVDYELVCILQKIREVTGKPITINSGSFHHMPAGPTGEKSGVAPPVQEQNALLPLLKSVRQKLLQLSAENRAVALPQLLPQIRDMYLGQTSAGQSLPQRKKLVFPRLRPVISLHGRSGGAQDKTCAA